MKMNKQPANTNQKTNKLCPRSKGHGEGNNCLIRNKGVEKAKPNGKPKKDDEKERISAKNQVTLVLKRLRRTTPFLPKALKSPDAFEKGKKGCDTCNIDKETYRSVIKSVKVIELIVDDVINKEQKEMLDKEDEEQDINKTKEMGSTRGKNKLSIQFEMFSQININHNLKCVLVKLQKTLGEILLQVSYCKAKKIPGDEKCKTYDVSVNVLEHLKFEYTRLTNIIIQLFKAPPTKQESLPDVCVACMKEEITDSTQVLEDMLKNGRNLKVTMRNEETGKEPCCSRTYPHVHALVQGSHVVLKYELPFHVVSPSQVNGKSKEIKSDVSHSQPYDKWPENFDEEIMEEDLHESSMDKGVLPKEMAPQNETPSENGDPKKDSISNESVKSLKSVDQTSDVPEKEHPEGKSLPRKSMFSEKGLPPKSSEDSKSRSSVLRSSSSRTQYPESSASEMFCGCNFVEVYEKFKAEQNENKDSQNPYSNLSKNENEERNLQKPNHNGSDSIISEFSGSLSTEDDESSVSNIPIKKEKQVSFKSVDNQPKVFYTENVINSIFQKGENHVYSVLQKPFDKPSESSVSSETSNTNIAKTSINTVDSVILARNKRSLMGKSKTSKELKTSQNQSGTPVLDVLQSKEKYTLCTKPIEASANMQNRPPRLLSKQQVKEVLKDLGAVKLQSVCLPAECYMKKLSTNEFKCLPDLPFSASIHSLPLDQDDLNYITQAVEKLIPNEDVVLPPGCDEEWEIQHDVNTRHGTEGETQWHKAFAARDPTSNLCIEIQTDKPVTRKKIAKNPSQKDIKNLPTIDEENENKSRKISLANESQEKHQFLDNKKSNDIFRTTEIRFFTVEYPNIKSYTKISNKNHEFTKDQYLTIPNYGKDYKDLFSGYLKNNPQTNNLYIKEVDDGSINDNYFSFCNSFFKSQSTDSIKLYDQLSENNLETKSLCPLDERIMLEVIYLSLNNNTSVTSMNSASKVSTHFRDNLNPTLPYIFHEDNTKPNINGAFKTLGSSSKQHTNHEDKDVLSQQIEEALTENINYKLGNTYDIQSVYTGSIEYRRENQTFVISSNDSFSKNKAELDSNCCKLNKVFNHKYLLCAHKKEESLPKLALNHNTIREGKPVEMLHNLKYTCYSSLKKYKVKVMEKSIYLKGQMHKQKQEKHATLLNSSTKAIPHFKSKPGYNRPTSELKYHNKGKTFLKSNIIINLPINFESPLRLRSSIQPSKYVKYATILEKKYKSGSPRQLCSLYSNKQPVADRPGKHFKNLAGKTSLKPGKSGLPLCDFIKYPIFDSTGNLMNEEDVITSQPPPVSDVLKFLDTSADPIVPYDFEGQPLASVHGTI